MLKQGMMWFSVEHTDKDEEVLEIVEAIMEKG